LNVPTSQANNVTTGRIYLSVIEKKEEENFLEKRSSGSSYHQ
jgi:CTP synthase